MTTSSPSVRDRPGAEGLREEVRNRLFRRVDWRFLLPDPAPAKSIVFGGDPALAEAVALVSGVLIETPVDRPDAGCDLAGAVDPDDTTLAAAWRALKPGGVCYTEWHRVLGRIRRVRRRLEVAGFEDVNCYWAWPDPARASAEMWLPLEAPGALAYFLSNRPRPRTLKRRIGRLIRRAQWTLPGLRPVGRVYAIARRPGGDQCGSSGSHHAALTEVIKTGWGGWGLAGTPDRLSWLLVTKGTRSIGKVVALVFAEPHRRPGLAVKMTRTPEAVPGLLNEVATLEALQKSSRPVPGLPRVLFRHEWAGLLAVGETALSGVALSSVLRRDNYEELARRGTSWLAELAAQSTGGSAESVRDRVIRPVVAEFASSFGPVLDRSQLDDALQILAELGSVPIVCEQRDFSPWNVLITDAGELAVLDWESAELRGLPALDLLYFLTYLALSLDGAGEKDGLLESYRGTLDADTFTGRVARACLERYLDTIGARPDILRPLRLLLWMLHSRSEYRRFVADVAGTPEPTLLRQSVFVRLWEEELRHARR
jgi:hypothetical protein